MKITNLNSRSPKQLKSKSKNIDAREQGVKRILLEKHKPKYICNVEKSSDKKNKKKSGLRS